MGHEHQRKDPHPCLCDVRQGDAQRARVQNVLPGVRRAAKKAADAQWWTQHNEEIRSTRPKQDAPVKTAEERDIEFRADCRAADKAGLSYGQYMLQKNKKPAGVGAPTSCCKG